MFAKYLLGHIPIFTSTWQSCVCQNTYSGIWNTAYMIYMQSLYFLFYFVNFIHFLNR